MFHFLGRLTTAHSGKVCIAWLLVGVAVTLFAPSWEARTEDDDIHFLPARCASVRGYQLLQQAFPRDVSQSRLIFAVERPNRPLTEADFSLVKAFVGDLEQLRTEQPGLGIGTVTSYLDGLIGQRLTSSDKHCTLIQVALSKPYLAVQTKVAVDQADARLRHRLADAGPDAPRLFTTGPAGIGRDLVRASAGGLEGTTLATVVLVVIILLLVYRSPLLAAVPLATIAAAVWVALKLLALFTLLPGIHLAGVSRVFAIVILYGAGTDYCLFLISRYQERLAEGRVCRTALAGSIREIGAALVASAGTVICGLGLMGCAEFAKVRCAGPAIGLSLVVALLASLTLAPALLSLLGSRAFWPRSIPGSFRLRLPGRRPWRAEAVAAGRFWDWLSRGIVARPLLLWTAAVAALLPLVILGLRVKPIYKPTGELTPGSSSVQGLAAIQRHFTAGEIGPITVLLASDQDWSNPAGRALIAHLSRGFAHLDNVAEVRSLTQPLGRPLPRPSMAVAGNGLLGRVFHILGDPLQKLADQGERSARAFYVASLQAGQSSPRFVTRLDVVLRSDPFAEASMGTLQQLQFWLRDRLPFSATAFGPVQGECYGVTVNAHDLAQVTEADRVRVNVLVLAGIFVILLLVVRRPWLAGYLLLTVLFSYFATLGATALLGWLWSGRPLDQVDWRVPFFLFTILVAVGEDYNIFVVTRMLQERRQVGAVEGTRRAIAHTGSTITCCGVIMAGTFATLMLAGLGTLIQIGFALAFGVLLDTFVIRPLLVPALTLCVWRWQGEESATASPGQGVKRKNPFAA